MGCFQPSATSYMKYALFRCTLQRRTINPYRRFGKTSHSRLQESRNPRTKNCITWALKMGPIGCVETSVRNFYTLRCIMSQIVVTQIKGKYSKIENYEYSRIHEDRYSRYRRGYWQHQLHRDRVKVLCPEMCVFEVMEDPWEFAFAFP
jgi:hypothetical protein